MTYGASATGGTYSHKHGYGVQYKEFYGSINDIALLDVDDSSKQTWKKPENETTGVTQHLSPNGASSSAINGKHICAATTYAENQFPYQTVYMWRRTS